MNSKQLAQKLNNIQYPARIPEALLEAAKANGLVIVYGASDDLIEFEGAVCEEVGCYEGIEVLIDRKGVLPLRSKIEDDETLENYFNRKTTAQAIEALWCEEDGYSWTYQTEIPHETFEVMEDDDHYCRGIVFALADIAKENMEQDIGCRVLDALRSYRCQFTTDEQGDGLPLVDVLSPGETIADGKEELLLLADYICGLLEELRP